MNDTQFSSAPSEWCPDERYRFQLAFFRENLLSPSVEGSVSVPPFNLVPTNEPDIKNISLFTFLNLGFLPKVKAQSEHQNFYLKLFKFPKEISPERSSKAILEKFFLTRMRQGQELQRYTAQAQNIFVKFGWIELQSNDFASRPFPMFLIPNNSADAQEYFDSSLPFSSLYVLPAEDAEPGLSEEQLIEHSYGGVIGFREELLKIYSNYEAIETANQDNMFVVGRQSCGGTTTMVRRISVITLKQLIDFNEPLRERPMPLNRDHDFLSSLLLVDYTDYIPDTEDPLEVPLTKEELERDWRPDLDSNHILEIASVVRL